MISVAAGRGAGDHSDALDEVAAFDIGQVVIPLVARALRRLMNSETCSPSCAPVRSANGQCLPDRCGLEAAVASEDRPKRAVVSPADKCRWGKSRGEFRPCAILLAEASVAQSLDGSRLKGSLHIPND